MKKLLAVAAVVVAWLRSGSSRREVDASQATDSDHLAIVEMLVVHSRSRLETQLQDSDEVASKAQGFLALDVGVLALLVTERHGLCDYWVAPAGALFVAGALLLTTIWPQEFLAGPEPREFYEEMGLSPLLAANRQMLAELLAALDTNDGLLRRKTAFFKFGFATLLLAFLGAVVVAFVS
jgi:hypothetical protein